MKNLGLLILFLLVADINAIYAQDGRVYECATSEDIYEALDTAKSGDAIILQGGKVYEINKSLTLKANGTAISRITFTSKDKEGLGRYAVLSTVGGKKEDDLVAVYIRGSFWNISRIEIAGKKIPLNNNYWDIHGFRIGLYFTGAASQYNIVEDVHIHHTHNTAVAIRDESHHNTFRRIKIHHIGEWLDADYNAHEAEGFYIGSSKGRKEGGNKARAYNIVIEDSVIGPGILGQYFDLKYATSYITVRNNVLYCDEKTYNAEIIKLAGFASIIKDNNFIGTNDNLIQYIKVDCQKKEDPVLIDYLGEKDVPPPSGKDNTITNNVFSTTDQTIIHVKETGCVNSTNNDPLGGEPIDGFPGWRASSWYLTYNVDFWPWIYHDEHDWQFVSENSTEEVIFLWDFGLGEWLFFKDITYRWMFLFGDNSGWIFTFEDNTPDRRFFQRFDNGSLFSVPAGLPVEGEGGGG